MFILIFSDAPIRASAQSSDSVPCSGGSGGLIRLRAQKVSETKWKTVILVYFINLRIQKIIHLQTKLNKPNIILRIYLFTELTGYF